MKPQLPIEVRKQFPPEVIHLINSFVPHLSKKEPPSPALQRELLRIQNISLKGKDTMYLKDFNDFILD